MKKILVISGVILALIALMIFNNAISNKGSKTTLAEVKKGSFEISVSNSGELIAENSFQVMGPVIEERGNQGRQRGGRMRISVLKIQDIVPEGTLVNKGEYIAQLDRSTYENTLKDELENLKTYQANLQMKILDTAVVLTNLRDDIKNQRYVVEEAQITLDQSKYEPPATIRKAETALEKAHRTLQQKVRSYDLRVSQTLSEIREEQLHLANGEILVEDLKEFLTKFTVLAPANGMVIYVKERNGTKRKIGSQVNPFDMVIATLPDLSSMISKTYVNEIDISKIHTGLRVNVNVDAFPDKTYSGKIISVANVGEQLPNSDDKMFEVLVRLDKSDPELKPSMTTGNKIIINSFEDITYIPTECVHTGSDSIPFVYAKNRTKQIVVLGKSNEKNIVIEQGLTEGEMVHIMTPPDPDKFRIAGEDLIPVIRERNKMLRISQN